MRRLLWTVLLCGCATRALDLPSQRASADLAVVDLAGVDLAGVDLAGVDLAGAPDLAVPDLASPLDLESPIVPPRPIAPMSTSTVTSQQPLLRWALPAGVDGAEVTICKDRACAGVVDTFAATGTSGSPSTALSPGLYFWRLRGRVGSQVGTVTSPVWEMVVGVRSAPINTSYGTFPDVNGDGHADVLVGAHQFSSRSSGAWLYLGTASGLSTTPITLALPGPGFGTSVDSAGDVDGDGYGDVAIGGFPNNTWLGTLCVFLGGPGGLAATPTCLMATQATQAIGGTVAGVGDVNGDGYGDVAVGSDPEALGNGGAYLYLGSPSGLDPLPIPLSPTSGNRVTGAGDLNGDGYADVAVASTDGTIGLGKILVYLGSPSGPTTPPIVLAEPAPFQYFSEFGRGLAGAGDVDGDGYADLAVGATAKLYIYRGGPSGPAMTPLVYAPPGVDGVFGTELGAARDLNGDGYADVVTGSQPYVYFGGPAGLGSPVFITAPAGYWYGDSEAGAGDIDGDGLDDLVIGASSRSSYRGAIAIYPGATSSFGTTWTEIMGPGAAGAFFGYSVASARKWMHFDHPKSASPANGVGGPT